MDGHTVALDGLPSPSLKLKRAIRAVVKRSSRGQFVANAPDLQLLLTGSGRTEAGAVRDLSVGIALQYRFLAGLPVRGRTAFHAKLLKLLRRYITESAADDDAGGISG